jgi:hypothetical protein
MAAMVRRARRLAAFAASVAVLWQCAGAVNAIEYDPLAHCCCGDHDASEPCHCPDCPGHGSLRFRTVGDEQAPEQATLHGCHPVRRAGALAHLPALLLPVTVPLAAPRDVAQAPPASYEPLRDRLDSPARPPS